VVVDAASINEGNSALNSTGTRIADPVSDSIPRFGDRRWNLSSQFMPRQVCVSFLTSIACG
jgi:hypothetical protein